MNLTLTKKNKTHSKEDEKNGDFILEKFSSKRAVPQIICEVLQGPNEDDILEIKFHVCQPTKMKGAMFVNPEKGRY